MDARPAARQQITAWATPDRKGQFAALAARRGLSESKLLGLLVDSVLERNPVDDAGDERHGETKDGERITLRLRPGDGKWLRLRAHSRGMKYSTYAAALIRAHVRANPPMPIEELARLERSLAEVSAMGRRLSQIAQGMRDEHGVDPGLREELAAVLRTVNEVRQAVREVVKVNRISWESANAQAS